MLFWLILGMMLAGVGADFLWYRRRVRPAASSIHRRAFVAWTLFTDALPIVIALTATFSRDNTPMFMDFAMWTFFLWMLVVPPRMVYYLFAALRLPRIGVAAGVCLVAIFVWGATIGRTTIRVSNVVINSERLPAGFEGFRIAQISDMHLGTLICPKSELQRIVEAVNDLNPDLIVFTGDLVNIRDTELDTRAMDILRTLKAPYGVVSVLGNHDVGAYIKDTVALPAETSRQRLVARQRQMGWQLLEDTTIYLRRGGDSISLTGISFDPALRHLRHSADLPPTNLHLAYVGVPDSLYNLTAVHIPQLWERITQAGYGDLTLSGHVHAMQFKLGLGERGLSPAQWLYDRWSGRYDQNGRTLYINDGTGYVVYPMRLGAYPEITLFTLQQ